MKTKAKTPKKRTARAPASTAEKVLVLRSCRKNGQCCSRDHGFVWPRSGPVACNDWDASPSCGQVNATTDGNDCWEWAVFRRRDGYGFFWYRHGDGELAHRAAYRFIHGSIPVGMQIDHLCRNRSCVNPDHLEPVTQQENVRRGAAGLHNAIKTHCPSGHEYTADNVTMSRLGCRNCKECHRASGRRRLAKRREAQQ